MPDWWLWPQLRRLCCYLAVFGQLAAGCLTILEMAVDDHCCPHSLVHFGAISVDFIMWSSCFMILIELSLGFLSGDHTFAYSFNEVVSLGIIIVRSWWKVGWTQGADSAVVIHYIAEPSSISECPNLPKVDDEQPQKSASVKPNSAGSSPISDYSRFPAVDEEQPKKSSAVKPNITEPSSNPDCPSPSPFTMMHSQRNQRIWNLSWLKPSLTLTVLVFA